MSFRQAINLKCIDCTYDNKAPGTWRQQITLCGAKNCPLYDARPKTSHPIPESTKRYYGVNLTPYQLNDGNDEL